MMHIQPSEGLGLSWQDYQGLLWEHNARHDPEGQAEEVEAPDEALVIARMERAAALGLARMIH